ncbi:uncharacterized protein SPPG_03274 [Spizellomyces punctatus DAOM BR117]|uniref:Palmitoyltransferase n=1 Tax=Spizellomyces punctatus (strain DAOM BR117) TaxID=645134 RepID=A0A0L0HKB3_SPIPD|nr:uncharacterized protein SPPG_03274 [Spizellomyces punctatus DAOM BR117]KND01473.1 hypothetical protein SPPG_03274 [Spizellomyces punctatus DAOM BR117]|eukprot:XP_016609512.1 hypothetical protein SPPG_03274 [Spizellomyces punctatus DAOM BR117]
MDVVTLVIIYVTLFACLVFILLFGEASFFRDGFIGRMHRGLTDSFPHYLHKTLLMICGQRVVRKLDSGSKYLLESRHPLLQIFYLSLITGCIFIFWQNAWPAIPNSHVGKIHVYTVPLMIASVYGSFILASWSNPGVLTRENNDRALSIWEYDHIIFTPKMCRTCQFQKPARSKHCSICKACIAKSDHHCAWINNCVGHLNYRWFLLFLFTTCGIAFYGSYLVLQIFRAEMDKRQIHDLWVMDRITQERSRISFKQKWLYMIHHEMMLAALGIFAALGGIVVLAFICYQLSLVFRGVTTNESFKWDDIDYDIRKGQLRMPRELYDFNHGRHEEDQSTTRAKGNTTATRRKGRKGNEKSHDQERDDYVSIKSIAQIKNIYHGGPWANLMDILFPSPLNV